ncbi:MAG: hypothetical protein HHAS10_06430 [Candidatus Altimarinota bacterium]
MKFQKTFYPYQNEILSVFEEERKRGDKKIHIVAPPGSGKTILGAEILCRIAEPALILVPNLTLLGQWQDKIESLFLEEGENAEELISTNAGTVKRINILTYQSLTGTNDEEDDEIKNEIYNLWYESEKNDFPEKEVFIQFLKELKESNPDEYQEGYVKQRKKIKNRGDSINTRKMMRERIFDYIKQLKEYGVKALIVDEAHHLTSWWSHVLYEIWNELDKPYIVGLTATPPFDNVDYFELDESYTKLLGKVDYIVPTPAIVRSGRLAPYSDLLYIVEPDSTLQEILRKREDSLGVFIENHKTEISQSLHDILIKDYENLKIKSGNLCDKWMRFIYTYKSESIDMGPYIHGGIDGNISLEDIAKSIGKWANDTFKKTKETSIFNEVKSLFFDLGYIWRGANLYRFETPLEKGLIYAKSKIDGVKSILKKEEENLSKDLKCAIITDFLDAESDWINCHSIFDELTKDFSHLCPYIVSGKGIWKYENGEKTQCPNETILSVTAKLMRGDTRLVIGTRGILGEGWDCPKLNTLIDLTGVSAYMSVNQVHGRAIRLDPENAEKVANIYDIVCIGKGYQGLRDFERIIKKHAQFYGVDDSGLVIKGIDHIYPQLEKNIKNFSAINSYTEKKSSLRGMMRELWSIGTEFKNEEIYSLSLEINKPFETYPISNDLGMILLLQLTPEDVSKVNILELGKTRYHTLIRNQIRRIVDASILVMKSEEIIPLDFTYKMNHQDSGSITILSEYKDTLISKYFLQTIAEIFEPITNQKYKYHFQNNIDDIISRLNLSTPKVGIPTSIVATGTLLGLYGNIFPTFIMGEFMVFLSFFVGGVAPFYGAYKYFDKRIQSYKKIKSSSLDFPLPSILSSNDEKRRLFLGKTEPKSWRLRFSKKIPPEGDIVPIEKTDIGKIPLLSAKIEKLWI